jgi:hypothetical protein
MFLALAAVVLLGCGSERADVKTVSDSLAVSVDLSRRPSDRREFDFAQPGDALTRVRAPESHSGFMFLWWELR